MNYFSLTLLRTFLPMLMVCFHQLNQAHAQGLVVSDFDWPENDDCERKNTMFGIKSANQTTNELTHQITDFDTQPMMSMSMSMNQQNNSGQASQQPQSNQNTNPQVAPSTINTQVLVRLAEDVSIEMMPDLIHAFLEEIDTRLAVVQSTQLTGNENHIRTQVHSVKSCARTFGAIALAEKAAYIEQMIDVKVSDIEIQIQQMLALLPSVKQAFNDYLVQLEQA